MPRYSLATSVLQQKAKDAKILAALKTPQDASTLPGSTLKEWLSPSPATARKVRLSRPAAGAIRSIGVPLETPSPGPDRVAARRSLPGDGRRGPPETLARCIEFQRGADELVRELLDESITDLVADVRQQIGQPSSDEAT